jgi:hypothetical protein
MKNKIASIVAAVSLLATPAFAGKFNLSEYKTVGVAPVLSSSDARGVFGTELAAQASGLSIGADKGAVAQKAAGKALENSGFGFAGKAQGSDVALLIISTTLGMLPVALKLDAAKAKANASQIQALMPKVEGRLAPDVVKAINIALTAVQGDDIQTAVKALLVAMAVAADSIKKGNERAHGYVATGIYAGIATVWAAAGSQNTALGSLGAPLITYLEEDAAMGGADRQVAAQLKIVADELNGSAPNLDKVVSAIGVMQNVKPD